MKSRNNQLGFSAVELLLVVVVVTVLSFVGYMVYNRQQNKTASTNSSQPTTTSDVQTAPPINSTADLDKAEATLNQTDPASSNTNDSQQLDSQLTTF